MEEEGGMMTPGFRFYPTEDELISFYFKHKIQGTDTSKLLQDIDQVIPQLHVYDFYPWDLPQHAGKLCRGDPEQWFFFIPRQEREARGGRTSRLTSSGYWKATGSPSIIYSSSNQAIGIKRTMVFYNGRAPTGKRTKWKMNEYKAFGEEHSSNTNPRSKLVKELSLCRIYIKSNCLRAFDRRPLGVMICEPKPIQQILHDNQDYATTSTHYVHQPIIERTVSTSYHIHNSSEEHTANDSWSMMEIEDQHLWNSEENHSLI